MMHLLKRKSFNIHTQTKIPNISPVNVVIHSVPVTVINTEVIKALRHREPRKAERSRRYQTEYKVTDVTIPMIWFDLVFLH